MSSTTIQNSVQGANRDLAAELQLNKVLNGQVSESDLSRTISHGSRAFSASLTQEANELSHVPAEMAKAKAYTITRQDIMTSVKDMLYDLKDMVEYALPTEGGQIPTADSTFKDNLDAGLRNMSNNIASLLASTSNDGQGLFADGGQKFDAGHDIVTVGGAQGMDTIAKAFGADFDAALNGADIDYQGLYDAMDAAFDRAEAEISAMSSEYHMLDTRSTLVQDIDSLLRYTADNSTRIITKKV